MRDSDPSLARRSFSVLLHGIVLLLVGTVVLTGCGDSGGMDDPEPSGPSFDSGTLAPSETFSYTFEDEGTEYYCKIHGADMEGRVTVSSDADSSGTARVTMENTSFNPARLSVQPGTEVVWTNNDGIDHTVTSGNPSSGGNGGDDY